MVNRIWPTAVAGEADSVSSESASACHKPATALSQLQPGGPNSVSLRYYVPTGFSRKRVYICTCKYLIAECTYLIAAFQMGSNNLEDEVEANSLAKSNPIPLALTTQRTTVLPSCSFFFFLNLISCTCRYLYVSD